MRRREKRRSATSSGAASIIVIFMIMVLFVFGMLSLTTAMANLRLSQKGVAWNQEYYALESEVEQMLFEIDVKLAAAELATREEMQRFVQASARNNISLDELYERYFYYHACLQLQSLPQDRIDSADINANRYSNTTIPFDELPQPTIYMDFNQGTEKHLLIGLQIVLPQSSLAVENGVVTGSRLTPSASRYIILDWREWQDPFDYEQDIWDSNINLE